MNILTVQGLTKHHGLKMIFSDVSLSVEHDDRIGVIGPNGSGKSTLLRILASMDSPDHGSIEMRQGLRISFLPQNPVFDPDHTVLEHVFFAGGEMAKVVRDYELVLHRLEETPDDPAMLRQLDTLTEKMEAFSAWEYEIRAKTILTRLGVQDFEARMGILSGGYRKRVALARALLEESDLLILDEPTNHLDADTIAWLEEYLQRLNNAVILVTHDRYFLDRVTRRIWEMDRETLREFTGNFSYYLERKSELEDAIAAQEARRRNILRKELEWLKRGPKARRTKQKARIERIDTLAEAGWHRPKEPIKFGVTARRLGTRVVELKDVTKSFDDKNIIDHFSYTIERGQRLGIIGPNGSGKTTLANLITGRLQPDTGSILVGQTVNFGYYDQESTDMPPQERAIDYIKRKGGELIRGLDGSILTAAAAMEQFNFTSQMMYSPIENLSGGERRRLYLVRTLMMDPNFLILDEPTNDLDITTLESLEDFLDGFGGCMLIISHDRYFLDRTVDQLITFEGEGVVRTYPGNYTDYHRNKTREQSLERIEKAKPQPEKTIPSAEIPPKLSYKERQEFAELEKSIPPLEKQIKDLEQQMIDAAADYVKLNQLTERHSALREKLQQAYSRWEALAERA